MLRSCGFLLPFQVVKEWEAVCRLSELLKRPLETPVAAFAAKATLLYFRIAKAAMAVAAASRPGSFSS